MYYKEQGLALEEEKERVNLSILEDKGGTHVFRGVVFNSLNDIKALSSVVDYLIIDTLFKDDQYAKEVLPLYKHEQTDVASIQKIQEVTVKPGMMDSYIRKPFIRGRPMIELLAPAGDLEKLKIAVLYGADAVFIGGEEFSLRARASNFTLDDIKEGCAFAHQHGKKVYVTTNIIPHHEDMDGLLPYLKGLEEAGVDAIIAASPYIIDTALKQTNLEVHISTQQSAMNINTVNFWTKKGATRVVLARI